MAAAGCTSSGDVEVIDAADSAETDVVAESETSPTSEPPVDESEAEVSDDEEQAADGGQSTDQVAAEPSQIIAPDDAWDELEEPWFVYGVDSDDVLNVRSGPGADSDVIFELDPTAKVLRYSEVVFNDADRWGPVAVGSGVGWVNLAFLRPVPSVSTPTVEGEPSLPVAELELVIGALGDPEALSSYVGPAGLLISTEAFVNGDEVVLSTDDLNAASDRDYQWGVESGSGDEIESSVGDYLSRVAGNPAFTSTEVIGHDVAVGTGNIPNNIADAFPGAQWIEYHFTGTSYFGGLDWESVSLVFDATGDELMLLAIVSAAWAP